MLYYCVYIETVYRISRSLLKEFRFLSETFLRLKKSEGEGEREEKSNGYNK